MDRAWHDPLGSSPAAGIIPFKSVVEEQKSRKRGKEGGKKGFFGASPSWRIEIFQHKMCFFKAFSLLPIEGKGSIYGIIIHHSRRNLRIP